MHVGMPAACLVALLLNSRAIPASGEALPSPAPRRRRAYPEPARDKSEKKDIFTCGEIMNGPPLKGVFLSMFVVPVQHHAPRVRGGPRPYTPD